MFQPLEIISHIFLICLCLADYNIQDYNINDQLKNTPPPRIFSNQTDFYKKKVSFFSNTENGISKKIQEEKYQA
jgi:hypothetical protein